MIFVNQKFWKLSKPFIQLNLNFHFTHTLSRTQHNFKWYQTSSRIEPESHQKLLQNVTRLAPDLLQNCSRIPPDSLQQLHQPAARIPPDLLQNSSRIPPALAQLGSCSPLGWPKAPPQNWIFKKKKFSSIPLTFLYHKKYNLIPWDSVFTIFWSNLWLTNRFISRKCGAVPAPLIPMVFVARVTVNIWLENRCRADHCKVSRK